jgi:ATP dependent DNA ligase-like protein
VAADITAEMLSLRPHPARPAGIRLLTRNGHDWTQRYPLIAAAVEALRVRSCLIDGEAVACGDDGLPAFDRLRYRRQDGAVFLIAFDLLELNGDDLRREPLEVRKATLASVLAKTRPGCSSMSTWHTPMPRWCSAMLARWGLRASCRSGWAHAIGQGGRPTGSR